MYLIRHRNIVFGYLGPFSINSFFHIVSFHADTSLTRFLLLSVLFTLPRKRAYISQIIIILIPLISRGKSQIISCATIHDPVVKLFTSANNTHREIQIMRTSCGKAQSDKLVIIHRLSVIR